MKQLLRCVNGHQWKSTGGGAVGGSGEPCPTCGASGRDEADCGTIAEGEAFAFSAAPGNVRNFPDIAGYEIFDELGRGGMGVVYKARQLKLNRTVALKMVLAGAHASDRSRARFLGEAEIAAGLQHSHIVQIYELGEHDGLPYITMEFVDGGGMPDWLAKVGDDYPAIAEFFEKLARGAHWAHQRAIVHRDLKPGNVLLGGDGEPKIGDFGLAKRLNASEDAPRLTISGEKMGTPDYMAPEQAFPELGAISPAADIYALGAMLYQALCGQVPIQARSEMEWMRKLHKEDPPSPAFYRPGVPRDLETIALKCLRKLPGERYASAEALGEDLRLFRAGEPILAKPLSAATKTWRWVRRRRSGLTALTLTAAVLVAAGWWARHGYWDVWETADVFASVAKIHGEYRGIGEPLAAEDWRGRLQSFRVVRAGRRGHCVRLESVDGAGQRTWRAQHGLFYVPDLLDQLLPRDRPCVSELSYNADGFVGEERLLDVAGHPVVRMRFSYPAGYRRGQALAPVQTSFLDEAGAPLKADSGLAGFQFFRDKRGFEAVVVFTDSSGGPVQDARGVSALRFDHDAAGRTTRTTNLDLASQPVSSRERWVAQQFSYNPRGQLDRKIYLDTRGQPAAADGVGVVAYTADSRGNGTSWKQLAVDGRTPARLRSAPLAPSETRWEYDALGRWKTITELGFDAAQAGFVRRTERYAWDAKTGVARIDRTYEDEAGGLVRQGGGGTAFHEEVDALGRPLRAVSEGWEPKTWGFAKVDETMTWEAGDFPKTKTTRYLDAQGAQAWRRDGPGRVLEDFDERGRVVRRTTEELNPKVETYFRRVLEFQFPESAKPAALRSGFTVRAEDLGFGSGDEPRTGPAGKMTRRQSSAGAAGENATHLTGHYEDRAGNTVACRNGNTALARVFDAQGRESEETQTGFDPRAKGYAKRIVRTVWDADGGSTLTWENYDADDRRVRGESGSMEYVQKYHGAGKQPALVTRKSGFGTTQLGYAVEIIESYDMRGDQAWRQVWRYEDAAGQPVRYDDQYFQYAEERDATGRIARLVRSGYDPALYPFDTDVVEMDAPAADGAERKTTTFRAAQGQPQRGPQGEWRQRAVTQKDGRRRTIYGGFDEARHGFAEVTVDFDAATSQLVVRFADGQGRAVEKLHTFIRSVTAGGQGVKLGLRPGDRLVAYNGRPVIHSIDFAFNTKFDGGTLEIERAGKPLRLENVAAGKFGIFAEDRAAK